jgi:hypothetical protein
MAAVVGRRGVNRRVTVDVATAPAIRGRRIARVKALVWSAVAGVTITRSEMGPFFAGANLSPTFTATGFAVLRRRRAAERRRNAGCQKERQPSPTRPSTLRLRHHLHSPLFLETGLEDRYVARVYRLKRSARFPRVARDGHSAIERQERNGDAAFCAAGVLERTRRHFRGETRASARGFHSRQMRGGDRIPSECSFRSWVKGQFDAQDGAIQETAQRRQSCFAPSRTREYAFSAGCERQSPRTWNVRGLPSAPICTV